ncbi:MAG: cupin domain-containing protein [Candidatus Hermodarchaeia archaeon]|jgi:mannose-6-phosphate isomerase-like protein (cupin superfamily)
MFVRQLNKCNVITALDGTILRELLNPLRDGTELKLRYSIAHASVPVGKASLPHKLTKASEVYYFLDGSGMMHIDDETFEVGPGSLVYVPPNATQYLTNTGEIDIVFLCIVDPYWRPEDEELVD